VVEGLESRGARLQSLTSELKDKQNLKQEKDKLKKLVKEKDKEIASLRSHRQPSTRRLQPGLEKTDSQADREMKNMLSAMGRAPEPVEKKKPAPMEKTDSQADREMKSMLAMMGR
jgi:hypothetical protein